MEELKKAVAFIFRMKGTREIVERQFLDLISFDLRWFPPEDARRFLAVAVESNVISRKEEMISPNFDIDAVEVGMSYKPDPGILTPTPEAQEEDTIEPDHVLMGILRKVERATGLARDQIMSRINAIQSAMDVEVEVAALIFLSDYGVDVRPMVRTVERELVARYMDG